VPSERVKGYKGGLAEGNPYAERRVMTADEHLMMRYVFFSFSFCPFGWGCAVKGDRDVVGVCVADVKDRLKASYAQLYEEKEKE
jgi:hypothetical protein